LKRALIAPVLLVIFGALDAPLQADDWRYPRNDRYDPYSRNDPYNRNDPYYGNDPYYRNDPYRGNRGYGGNPVSIASRVASNLRSIFTRSRMNGHERDHFRKADQELSRFISRYESGKFDTGRLDNAMKNMRDLAQSNQVHPNDRRMIANDIGALSSLRSGGGYYRDRGVFGPFGR
jgi:hypothetical protein